MNENEHMEEESPYRRFSPMSISLMFVGFLLLLGLGIYLVMSHHEKAEEEKMTVAKTEEIEKADELSYDYYTKELHDSGIKAPIDEFTYNVKIPEEGRKEIDPMFDDAYIGYAENENLQAALWPVDGGFLFILYSEETNQVKTTSTWTGDYQTALDIEKIRGEKALLTKETMKEENTSNRKKNIQTIAEYNDQLLNLFNEVNANFSTE